MTGNTSFGGSIPRFYHEEMVPLLFGPYAPDMAEGVRRLAPSSVLETAAGSGAVTRELASRLPATTQLTATDLNPSMVEFAKKLRPWGPVTWRQADALELPFPDRSFDVVASQFGVMFYADRPRGLREALRVLRPGGTFLFTTWDDLEHNAMVAVVDSAVAAMFPGDPPTFLRRVPHGYHEPAWIVRDAKGAGSSVEPKFERLERVIQARSARAVAQAYCSGTPLRSEIEARAPERLQEAVDRVQAALEDRFGRGSFQTATSAFMITLVNSAR